MDFFSYRHYPPKMPAKEPKRKVLRLRVSSDSNQGGRDHMEDMIAIRYERGKEHDSAFIGIFDGHGGKEAAVYARDLLWDNIKGQRGFESKDPEKVKQAINDGFLKTQEGMWKRRATWGTTKSGYPSTSGTTACVAIIRQGQLWVAHVGDSRAVLGVHSGEHRSLRPCTVTDDHKPESPREIERIHSVGGQVLAKNGVQRVVWQRTKRDHTGPVRRSTFVDQIPFLAVARSLGDLWSYSTLHDDYVVSPKPDISYRVLNPKVHQCLVLGTDGLWNMLSSSDSIYILSKYNSEKRQGTKMRETMAQRLVKNAINRWVCRSLRADNTTAITIIFDFPKEKPKDTPTDDGKAAEQPVGDKSPAGPSATGEQSTSSVSSENEKEEKVEGGSPRKSPASPEGARPDEEAEEEVGTKLVIRGETDFVGVQGFGTIRPKLRHSSMYRDFVFRFHYPEPEEKQQQQQQQQHSWFNGGGGGGTKRKHEEDEEEDDYGGWNNNKPSKPDGKLYINTPVVEVTNKKIPKRWPPYSSSSLSVSPWLEEERWDVEPWDLGEHRRLDAEPKPKRWGLAPKKCDCFQCHNNWTDFCMRRPVNADGESAIKRHNIQIIREYKLKKSAAKRRRVSAPVKRLGIEEIRQSRYNTRSSPTEPDVPLAQRALRSLNKGATQSPRPGSLATPKKRLTRLRRAPIKSC